MRMTALARISNCKRRAHPLVREDVIQGLKMQVFSWKIKLLVVSLKGVVTKTNSLAVNCQS
jgi:hypothetical protein